MKGEAFTLPLNKRKEDEMKQNQKDTIRMELKRLRADIVTYQGEMNGRLARILDEAKMTTFGDDNSVLIIEERKKCQK